MDSDSDIEQDPEEVFEKTIRRLNYRLIKRNTDPTKRGVWDVVKIETNGSYKVLDDNDPLQRQAHEFYDMSNTPPFNIRLNPDSGGNSTVDNFDKSIRHDAYGRGGADEEAWNAKIVGNRGGTRIRSRKSKKSKKSRKSKKSYKKSRKSRRYRR